ncbi:MAG: GDP-mannose 4,6-dehydratase [Bacilli bacterium]|jgi:UDP-glucose 4-epimerase|nr:GDP-mannose 4,6-dehydratase [Bacilli bacterium]
MGKLIIGGAGFIGSHLCDSLLNRGENVVCIDNLMRGTLSNVNEASKNSKFVFINHDANDQPFLESVIKQYHIDFIYHLAANSDIQASAGDPSIEFECTCSTTWHVLSAMRNTGVKNLFFASTSALYGKMMPGHPFNEQSPMNPISYYGSAKMASEAFISAFSYMNDLNVLVFRFPNVIGKRLTHGVIFDFISRLKKDPSKLVVLGNGTQTKPYIYADDLIKAILLLAPTNKGRNIYEIGVDGATSVKFIAENVVKEMGLSECEIVYGKDNVGWKGDVPIFAYDYDKIKQTGWRPSMTSDEAVLATIRYALGK